MDVNATDLVLSKDEIEAITHRKRAKEQLRDLIAMGIPAAQRHDSTICVLRADVTTRRMAANAPDAAPQRKSAKQ